MPNAPRVLVFDIFGTVVDWHGSIVREMTVAHPQYPHSEAQNGRWK